MGYSESWVGFVWDERALYTLIAGGVLVVAALILFFVFGKKREQLTRGEELLKFFEDYPRAVVGSFFKGVNKEVGASEYMATLMALAHKGVLTIVYDDAGVASGLRIQEKKLTSCSTLEKDALMLLRCFAEDDGTILLATAKQRGERDKALVDTTYRSWRTLVKNEAKGYLADRKAAFAAQKALLYGAYVIFVIAVLCGYLISLMLCTILLATGAVLALLSISMQRRIFNERQNAKRLFLWLDSLATHLDEVALDEHVVQELLEYACLFTLANKVSRALSEKEHSEAIARQLDLVDFWRELKQQLYTDSKDYFAKKTTQEE